MTVPRISPAKPSIVYLIYCPKMSSVKIWSAAGSWHSKRRSFQSIHIVLISFSFEDLVHLLFSIISFHHLPASSISVLLSSLFHSHQSPGRQHKHWPQTLLVHVNRSLPFSQPPSHPFSLRLVRSGSRPCRPSPPSLFSALHSTPSPVLAQAHLRTPSRPQPVPQSARPRWREAHEKTITRSINSSTSGCAKPHVPWFLWATLIENLWFPLTSLHMSFNIVNSDCYPQENAALCDEVAHLEEKFLRAKEERRSVEGFKLVISFV